MANYIPVKEITITIENKVEAVTKILKAQAANGEITGNPCSLNHHQGDCTFNHLCQNTSLLMFKCF